VTTLKHVQPTVATLVNYLAGVHTLKLVKNTVVLIIGFGVQPVVHVLTILKNAVPQIPHIAHILIHVKNTAVNMIIMFIMFGAQLPSNGGMNVTAVPQDLKLANALVDPTLQTLNVIQKTVKNVVSIIGVLLQINVLLTKKLAV